MKFTFLNAKTNKPMTEDEFERIIGVRSDCLYINKDGIGIALLDDGDMVPVCLRANGVTIRPKNITNFEWIKQMDKDELAKVVRSQGKEYHNPCAYAELDNCEMKCEEGFRKWLDQEVK